MSASASKTAVAEAALAEVESGMMLGLGSGSTATAWLHGLAERLRTGRLRDVRGVPTSHAIAELARELEVPLVDLPSGGVDLAVDGMDELDARLDAIKGLGGAMVREKVVAESADRLVLIGERDKRVGRLGERAPLPVEVLAFGRQRTEARLRALDLVPVLRGGEADPELSDNGLPILDCAIPEGADPHALDAALNAVPGVLGHGLFLGLARVAYLGDGTEVTRLERPA